jgi:hypothetical protein
MRNFKKKCYEANLLDGEIKKVRFAINTFLNEQQTKNIGLGRFNSDHLFRSSVGCLTWPCQRSLYHVKIIMDDRQFTTSMTFASFEELLPRSKFIRVHRSFIINKSKIRLIEGNRIVIGTIEIPIGSNYRGQFFLEIGIK